MADFIVAYATGFLSFPVVCVLLFIFWPVDTTPGGWNR